MTIFFLKRVKFPNILMVWFVIVILSFVVINSRVYSGEKYCCCGKEGSSVTCQWLCDGITTVTVRCPGGKCKSLKEGYDCDLDIGVNIFVRHLDHIILVCIQAQAHLEVVGKKMMMMIVHQNIF